MITILISTYLIIGLFVTIWFLITTFSMEGVADYFVNYYDEVGTSFALLCSAIFIGLGLFWPMVIGVLLWYKYH